MLQGKITWITGASRGIGQGIALSFARLGAQTVLVAREVAHLHQTAALIQSENLPAPILMEYDITDSKAVAEAFKEVFKKTKRLDVLVNNAGVIQDALLGMITDDQLQQTFAVNVFAAIYHIQYASRLMARNMSGSIINISSIVALNGFSGLSVYGASKAALIGVTSSAAKELAVNNIRINALAPGFIDTDMAKALTPERFQQRLDSISMKRIGTPEDVAGAAVFLASDLSRYVTGQVLGVDGGMIV